MGLVETFDYLIFRIDCECFIILVVYRSGNRKCIHSWGASYQRGITKAIKRDGINVILSPLVF